MDIKILPNVIPFTVYPTGYYQSIGVFVMHMYTQLARLKRISKLEYPHQLNYIHQNIWLPQQVLFRPFIL